MTGDLGTRLVVLRGNSGSGKSTTAQELRGHGTYYFQLSLDETLRRHAGRPLAKVVTPDAMRGWYQSRDVLGVPGEHVSDETSSLNATVERIRADLSWEQGADLADLLD